MPGCRPARSRAGSLLAEVSIFNKGSTNPLPVCAAAKYDQAEMREEPTAGLARLWKGIADGGRFPRRDEIDPWLNQSRIRAPVVLRGTESLLTHRWRGMDSNLQFRDALAPATAWRWCDAL